ncbi:oxytocin-neurophysin 1-like [Patiria miniata]|uniref:Uncharacterized protein n=1 Tax=Patiria miniata TaxID=46514 RepID=A0A914B4S0_PATMI|nr:oxytocin-neurophysin 1-like [Patiria miniata]
MGMRAAAALWTGVLVALWLHGQACLVQDCPEGGKRSGYNSIRQCLSCGPGGTGQCVGSAICCGDSFGCLMGTKEAYVCQEEIELPTPCEVVGETCEAVADGKCVSNGFCCSSRSCSLDTACRTAETGQRNLKDRLKERLIDALLRQP